MALHLDIHRITDTDEHAKDSLFQNWDTEDLYAMSWLFCSHDLGKQLPADNVDGAQTSNIRRPNLLNYVDVVLVWWLGITASRKIEDFKPIHSS